MIRDYRILKHIGTGSFGKVYKVEDNRGNVYAMKKIATPGISTKEKLFIINEISLLKLHKSKYIIKYYDSFYENNYIYIISEYAERGDFSSYLRKLRLRNKKLSDKWICRFFLQVCIGINYLHKNKVIHRDIKSSNIFIDKDFNVKIGDFGIAKPFDRMILAKTSIGSPYYMSPELFKEEEYNEKTDVWSLGCFLYELITFTHPFDAKNLASLTYKVINTAYPTIYLSNNNQFYNSLLRKMLDKNKHTRISCSDILKNDSLFTYAGLSESDIEYGNDINKHNKKIPKIGNRTIMWDRVISEINNIIIETTLTNIPKNTLKPSEVAPLSPIRKRIETKVPSINRNEYREPLDYYVPKKEAPPKRKPYEYEKSNYSYELPTIKVPNLDKYFVNQASKYSNRKANLRPISALYDSKPVTPYVDYRPYSVIDNRNKDRYSAYKDKHKLPNLNIPDIEKKKTHFQNHRNIMSNQIYQV